MFGLDHGRVGRMIQKLAPILATEMALFKRKKLTENEIKFDS
jgi:hypothetical protein